MRALLVIALLFALPALYIGYNDYVKYTQNPHQGFVLSTVGDVWLDHDYSGFMKFKSGYKDREEEWDNNIRPRLKWNALPIAILPAAAFYLWVFFCWLLGRGPFHDWGNRPRKGGGFSRTSGTERANTLSYRRK